jgi:hypothetical protein
METRERHVPENGCHDAVKEGPAITKQDEITEQCLICCRQRLKAAGAPDSIPVH